MPKSNEQLDYDNKKLSDQIKVIKKTMSVDPKQFGNKSTEVITNHLQTIRRGFTDLLQMTHAGNRKVGKQFGYPLFITSEMYLDRYNRQDIANRIINAYPEACWNGDIKVTDDLDTENQSIFEKAYEELSRKLKLINFLTRSDKLAGLGEYSVLYIGLNDGVNPDLPLEERKFDLDDVLFLKPFTQTHAEITQFNNDAKSPRFGFPEFYNLQIGDNTSRSDITGGFQATIKVHWTRVIHIAEGVLENDIVGIPRLRPIFNRLMDLEKVVGASAELFWLNGRGGLNFNIPGDVQIKNEETLIKDIENYVHELTRILRTRDVEVKPIQFSIPDPESNVNVLLKLISGSTGIPQRILTGSERGELASSQDQTNFDERVQERQHDFCEPALLRASVDWFIRRGILPSPQNDIYEVIFPVTGGLSELEKADRAQKLASSISAYVNAFGVEAIIPKKQFVEDVLNLDFKEKDVEQNDFQEGESDRLTSETTVEE